MKNYLSAIIYGIAIVLAALFLANGYAHRYSKTGEIRVTGLGTKDFSSDFIVWEGSFETVSFELAQAYERIEKDKAIIMRYLEQKGVPKNEIVFSAVNTGKETKPKYNDKGQYSGEEFAGYRLTQNVQINSKEVDKIESLSREITELLHKGVRFYSLPPRYYFTGLSDLKIEMISKATEDGRLRAEMIAKNSGGVLGKLKSAKMGVFQITGQNSSEGYSWGGTFNTASREKTASITVKLIYQAE